MAGLLTADELSEFIRRGARDAFEWGARDRDCALWAAAWFEMHRGYDPAAPIRGRYRTARGYLRIVRKMGGLVKIVDDLTGMPRTACPRRGDVVCVSQRGFEALAIACGDGRVVARAARGVAVWASPLIAAWRL